MSGCMVTIHGFHLSCHSFLFLLKGMMKNYF